MKGGLILVCYVVANRKGGVGKSSTSSALFNWFECQFNDHKNHKYHNHTDSKVLLIDLDSQCNVSFSLGIDVVATSNITTIADVFAGTSTLEKAMIQHSENGYIVPGSELLTDYDNGTEDFKVDLKTALKSISKKFQYCIIDAPPSLGRLTVSALLAGDELIIPSQADIYSVQGLNSMIKILESVQEYNKIHVAGILLTRNNERLLLTKMLTELLDEKAKELNTKIFKSSIREGVAIREASAQQIGLFDYDPKLKSNVAIDYDNFIRELLEVK